MAQNLACDVLSELAVLVDREKNALELRATSEKPKRVSVIDVILIVTGATDAHVAAQILRRMLETYAELKEKIDQFRFPGQGQRETPVTDVRGMVEIIMLLPGVQAARIRRTAAEILVRYLGGDLTIIDEVVAFRNYQENTAGQEPRNACRLFGEAIEATMEPAHGKEICKRLLDDVRAVIREELRKTHDIDERLAEVVSKEMQRTHHWDFQRRGSSHNTLVDLGVIVDGEELTELDNDEHVVRVVDFLKAQIPSDEWKWHGNKLKNIFAVALKKKKIEKRISEDLPFFITKNQGEYRIIYTEADHELMMDVFKNCKRRFSGIVTRDEAILKSHRKQRRIQDYFTRDAAATSNTSTSDTQLPEDNILSPAPDVPMDAPVPVVHK